MANTGHPNYITLNPDGTVNVPDLSIYATHGEVSDAVAGRADFAYVDAGDADRVFGPGVNIDGQHSVGVSVAAGGNDDVFYDPGPGGPSGVWQEWAVVGQYVGTGLVDLANVAGGIVTPTGLGLTFKDIGGAGGNGTFYFWFIGRP
jgi:hypothetical protein